MKREKLRRVMFVGSACLFSFPWLTPCVGIWSAAAVNGVHDSVTKRDEPLNRLSDAKLKAWEAKPLPRIAVFEHQGLSRSLLVTDAELSGPNGGRNASRPGTFVGKGTSALVDGVTYTLTWVDPFTWISGNILDMEPTKPKRRLVLCESPFVMIEAGDIRFVPEGKTGGVRLAKASNAKVTVITPEGSFFARAQHIHYRGPSQEVVLEQPWGVYSGTQDLVPAKPGSTMRLNFVKRGVSSAGGVIDRERSRNRIDGLLLQKRPAAR
ncbi:MAG: hypothetical protein JNM65_14025 [Verrucomicrobiaceae bacterium]|nr:hypothetical protein [Verrucomicrobiaceae bacterium]